jgi:ABC-type molybdate transport system ATPase subunit
MYMSHNEHVHIVNDITLTELRKRLFQVADRVLESGASVRIRRGGRTLTLSADDPRRTSRLARLKRRNVIAGDARTLWKVKVGKWRGGKGLG